MIDADEEKSCHTCVDWMKPRELCQTVKQYFEHTRNNSTMAEASSHSGTKRFAEKTTRNLMEKVPISMRDRYSSQLEANKENPVKKNTEVSNNMVKRLKMRYEEISQKNVMATVEENTRVTGAIKKRFEFREGTSFGIKNRVEFGDDKTSGIKKRVEFGDDKTSGIKKRVEFGDDKTSGIKKRVEFGDDKTSGIKKRVEFGDDKSSGIKKRVEFGDEKNGGTKKRIKINASENDVFAKPRFKIYADERPQDKLQSATKNVDEKIDDNAATAQHVIQNRRLNWLMPESSNPVQERFTPIDGLGVPLLPKKVKVQHRKSLRAGSEKPNNNTGSIVQEPVFKLPYEADFVELELEKDKPMSRMSRGFREKNITHEQRKIILKFLIRLNVHSFYPSFLLYQTVRLFDAVLDAKVVGLEEMQLVALGSMWIALKREEITYKVPSATTMISYSKDLYEGRVDLLLKCEMDILRTLNFEIVFPDPFSIMSYYITTCKRSQLLQPYQLELIYYSGGYMLDLSLFDEELMLTSAVLLAAAAAETALFFVADGEKCEPEPFWFKWRAPDASRRFSEEEIGYVRSILIQLIKKSHERHSEGEIIFKKYKRSRYGKISHSLCNKVEMFLSSD